MRKASKRAFTLIELLVVIAIIAILAAILFPVFAQAKEAAKDSHNVSNQKQFGLAVIMYVNNNDDYFPLSMILQQQPDKTFYTPSWQDAVYPYAKSWDIMLHPKRNRPKGQKDDVEWQRLQLYGMPARAAVSSGARNRRNLYYRWSFAPITGGETVRFEGLGGFATNVPDVEKGWLGRVEGPSRAESAIGSPGDMVLAVESFNWDLWWSIVPEPMNYCVYWVGAASIVPNPTWTFSGPGAFKGNKAGEQGMSRSCNNNIVPKGITTYVAVDGSAKSVDYRGKLFRVQQLPSGVYVHPHFWPEGTN